MSVVATHPIQYQVPWFRALAATPGLDLSVLFAAIPDAEAQGVGFGVPFQWDVPLLAGYRWEKLSLAGHKDRIDSFFSTWSRGLKAALIKANPDVVILTGWNSVVLLQALILARKLKVPCLVRGESTATRKRSLPVRIIHRQLLRRYEGFLVIGSRNREFYEEYQVDSGKMFACPYFIENERFRSGAKAALERRAELRNRWGIPREAICFLFAGKLQPKKHFFDLLEATAIASKRDPRIHLLVVGAGEQEDEARRRVAEAKPPVSLAGFLNQTEIPEAYAASDCLVLPSDAGETWGLVVNEAMACGLPAIVSDQVGCAPDLIIEGKTGSVFPMGNSGALASRMVAFAADLLRIHEMGMRAQKRVCESYSVERAVEGTIAALEYAARR